MTHEFNKQHKDYRKYAPKWELVDHVVKSECKDVENRQKYIPKPNPDDTSQRNILAYDNYVKRALFYNFTKPTQVTLLGSMFRKKPVIEIVGMDYALTDIDGSGLTLEGQAKDIARELTETSRGGLFVDYTSVDPALNLAQEKSKEMRPIALFYKAKSIINWETTVVNSMRVLSKVVLAEYEDEESRQHDKERVIYLNEDGICQIDLYTYEDGEFKSIEEVLPTNAAGQHLNYVPFKFVGGLNNDESIDEALLYDMAALNVAHLQSSADYEDFRYKLGQIQPVITGLTSPEMDKNGGSLQFGSGVAWTFGAGTTAQLLQAQPNSANFESMQHKETQALAIGAKLQNPNQQQKSATEASIISNSESASIVTVVDNIESAYKDVFAMMLDRVTSGSIEIAFSREFVGAKAIPQELQVLGELEFKGLIPDVILFNASKASDYISDEMTIEEWRELRSNSALGMGLDAE